MEVLPAAGNGIRQAKAAGFLFSLVRELVVLFVGVPGLVPFVWTVYAFAFRLSTLYSHLPWTFL